MKCHLAACGLAALAMSCAPYTQMKIDLVDQSRKGLTLIQQSTEQRQALINQFYTARRTQLDQAFDIDARSRVSLAADWVIDARQAYAVGLDAIHHQTESSQRAHEQTLQNIAAVDEALQQLQLLHRMEQRLAFPEARP